MIPGLRLRQVRERLGLTYRDVERSSFELAAQRGRSDFILHISRLADIENHGVVPSLHKIYTLAVVYHLNPLDIFRWYEVPIDEFFGDGGRFPRAAEPSDGSASFVAHSGAFRPVRSTPIAPNSCPAWSKNGAVSKAPSTAPTTATAMAILA